MKKIKITLVKSVIDRPETAKRTIIALGLKKLNASVEVEATPQILGMVRRAAHLLKVEDIQIADATPAVAVI
ncbi:MAG: 50S ribosomal protein L30 [Segetibacter sp.]